MGQREVLNFLMKNPSKWHNTKEIRNEFNCSYNAFNKAIRKLKMNNEIEELIIPYKVGKIMYRDRFIRIGVRK